MEIEIALEHFLLLKKGCVEKWVKSAHADLFDLAHHTHDLARPIFVYLIGLPSEENLLPNGIFVREITVRQCLANHHSPRSAPRVALLQVAPFLERNLHGAKVARAHFIKSSQRPFFRRRSGVPQD